MGVEITREHHQTEWHGCEFGSKGKVPTDIKHLLTMQSFWACLGLHVLLSYFPFEYLNIHLARFRILPSSVRDGSLLLLVLFVEFSLGTTVAKYEPARYRLFVLPFRYRMLCFHRNIFLLGPWFIRWITDLVMAALWLIFRPVFGVIIKLNVRYLAVFRMT